MNNKWLILTATLLSAAPLIAQDAAASAAPAGGSGILDWSMNNMVLVLGAIIILGAFLALYNTTNMLLQAQKMRILQDHGIEVLEKVAPTMGQPWWKRMYDQWTDVVPIEKEDEIMIDHPHDGIYELDNSLPPWWLALFYICIIYGVGYFAYYHVFDYGNLQIAQFEQEMEMAEEAKKAYLATQANLVDETNVVALVDEQELALGQSIYETNCVVCHGVQGEGGIGPNMTDAYWLHGGSIQDVFSVVKYGVVEKGMQSWQSLLRPADMQRVSSYILTMQGTNPPNAKDPQGELYEPEVVPAAAVDTTATQEGEGLSLNDE